MTTETNDYIWTDGYGRGKAEALPPGPWQDEPDKLVWIDEASNLDCMIVRGALGNLCGYVGVPPDHPLHGEEYNEEEYSEFDCISIHGGLTYSSECRGVICHIPEPGRPLDVWWFGFDCAHYIDQVPGLSAMLFASEATYKNIEYVTNEVTDLAAQLAELASAATNQGEPSP